jgi:hypothetical protein
MFCPGLLSQIAAEMKRRIIVNDRLKDGIKYTNVFDGKESVLNIFFFFFFFFFYNIKKICVNNNLLIKDKLKEIIQTNDRAVALRIGRALESQRYFHDVNYENRLIDNLKEIYQFNDILDNNRQTLFNQSSDSSIITSMISDTITSGYSEEDIVLNEDDSTSLFSIPPKTGFHHNHPHGIYTELLRCYSPTCDNLYPCYSYTCPKRERLVKIYFSYKQLFGGDSKKVFCYLLE